MSNPLDTIAAEATENLYTALALREVGRDSMYAVVQAALADALKAALDSEAFRRVCCKYLSKAFGHGNSSPRHTDQASEYWSPAFEFEWAPEMAKEIIAAILNPPTEAKEQDT